MLTTRIGNKDDSFACSTKVIFSSSLLKAVWHLAGCELLFLKTFLNPDPTEESLAKNLFARTTEKHVVPKKNETAAQVSGKCIGTILVLLFFRKHLVVFPLGKHHGQTCTLASFPNLRGPHLGQTLLEDHTGGRSGLQAWKTSQTSEGFPTVSFLSQNSWWPQRKL